MRASTLCGNHRHLACFHGAFGRRLRRRVAVVSAAFDRLEVKTKKDEESQRGKMTSGVASAVHVGFLERPSLRVEERRSVLSEEWIEKVIYGCRFFALLGVSGSLVGSVLCFLKGTVCITSAFIEYFLYKAKITSMLIEAVDVYLIGTVMLVFGVGLYELFISNLDIAKISTNRSSLFGRFMLKERPKWLEIKSVNELKTKLGHVIVMLLLVGLFEKSKKVLITRPADLLCFAASILLSSCGLYLLSKLRTQTH